MERRSWFKKIGLAVLGFGGIAFLGAFRGGHGHGMGHDPARMERMLTHHLEDVLDDVDATPEQRQKITAIKDRLVARGKTLHQDRREEMKQLLAQWDAATPDKAAIHAKIDARGQQMQAFAHEVADALVEVHDVLTPAQREKISAKWRRRLSD